MSKCAFRIAFALILALVILPAQAEVSLPRVLGDHMVLQRERAVPVWGTAAPGERVTVRFGAQTKSVVADPAGNWRTALDALPASSTPADLTVSGSNTITLRNVLVGEVWICSGQSNMEFPMRGGGSLRQLPPMAEALAKAAHPGIRLFKVEKNEREFTTTGWAECTPETAAAFSAVGYYFGREIHQELNVPVGLIQSAWGGSHIERWTPAEAYEKSPVFASKATSKPVRIDNQRAGQYFEPMVRPLVPFAVRGMLWYQGESNIINSNDGVHYLDKFKVFANAWRSIWGQGDFPIYTVQIAPYYYTRRNDPLKHSEQELPLLWEAQSKALNLPNIGMAGTMDLVDNFADIHPPDKWTVGHRLALWALAKDYGRPNVVHSGPIYKWVEFRGGKARIHFYSAGSGLATRDNKPPTLFEVAAVDGVFHPATAVIEGDTVLVSNPDIPLPEEVRFAWHEIAQPNLINKEGLPAIPFRTDR